jgi:hypothetical protein
LAAADEDIGYRRAMSQQLYGREIPYVLLMHIGALDARMAPRLFKLYQSRGFSFVTLEEAEKDPFYKYDVDPKLLPGPDTLEGAIFERHLPLPQKKDYSAELAAVCK